MLPVVFEEWIYNADDVLLINVIILLALHISFNMRNSFRCTISSSMNNQIII